MEDYRDLGKLFRESGLTKHQLSQACGVSNTYLAKLEEDTVSEKADGISGKAKAEGKKRRPSEGRR